MKAVELNKGSANLDTLACAYAAKGDYANAIKTEQEAVTLITDNDKKKEYEKRIEGFKQHKSHLQMQVRNGTKESSKQSVPPTTLPSGAKIAKVRENIQGAVSATDTNNSPQIGGMVLIPAGSCSMGAFDDKIYDARWVYVSAFYIEKNEITKSKWDAVYAWAVTKGYTFSNTASGKASSRPVCSVTWYDCVKWCNARSQMERLTPCYTVSGSVYRTGQCEPECNWSANGYRLPTEAEWEKAARGGSWGAYAESCPMRLGLAACLPR